MKILNPKEFLLWGGVVLVVVGLLGYLGVIGPTPEQSIFGSAWWFDNAENVAHTVLGLVAIGASFYLNAVYQKWLTVAVGALGVVVGLYSLAVSQALLGANLENPADTVLHLAVGAWALYAAYWGKK